MTSLRACLLLTSLGLIGAACSPAAAPDGSGDNGNGNGTKDDGTIDLNPPGDGDGDDIDVNGGDGDGSGGGGNSDGDYCNDFALNFEPQTPTVYLLVDRSGSMKTEGFWIPLRDGLLPAVQELQADVRFGFGTYTSTMASQCVAPTSVVDDLGTIGENNYQLIADKYNAYPEPDGGDTPTPAALAEAKEILLADPSPGKRYIVLVTDGNPDFCDNGNAICRQDVTIAALQETAAAGIETIVFGLEAKMYPIDAGVMTSFANAGAGLPVDWSAGLPIAEQGGNTQISNECQGVAAGTYSEPGGTAEAFLGASPEELVASLKEKVSGLKSCTIEFNFEVKDATTGEIFVHDEVNPIPQDQWRMNTPTEIELLGDACTQWQSPEVSYFFAGFPCAAIIQIVK